MKEKEVPGGMERAMSIQDFHPLEFVNTFKKIEWTHLWDIFTVRFLMGFALLVYRSNFAMMLDYKFGVSAKTVGYMISYSSVVGTVSGFLVGKIAKLYQDEGKLLFHASILSFLSISVLIFSPSLMLLMVSLAPLSISSSIARVCLTNLTIEKGRGQDTGVLLGLGASIISVSRMMSPAVGGIAQEFHVAGPGIVGSMFAAMSVIVLFFYPQHSTVPEVIKRA